MNYEQRRINWPALGAAAAIALALTFGLPVAMNAGAAPDGYLPTLAAASMPYAAATQVTIDLPPIEVVAVRERPAIHGFWLASHKRAG
ncbi:MAG TPA: hypothetical protein VLR71_20650 [Casimicrobiaceae bacterium]|nr:hypothetical protein [Casimicrobiaceae bacterium]